MPVENSFNIGLYVFKSYLFKMLKILQNYMLFYSL